MFYSSAGILLRHLSLYCLIPLVCRKCSTVAVSLTPEYLLLDGDCRSIQKLARKTEERTTRAERKWMANDHVGFDSTGSGDAAVQKNRRIEECKAHVNRHLGQP